MGFKVEFLRQRFIELLIKLLIVELLVDFSTCSRREGVTPPILWNISSLNISCFIVGTLPFCRGDWASNQIFKKEGLDKFVDSKGGLARKRWQCFWRGEGFDTPMSTVFLTMFNRHSDNVTSIIIVLFKL